MKRIPPLIRQKKHKWRPCFPEVIEFCFNCERFYVGVGKTRKTAGRRIRGRIGAMCYIEIDWKTCRRRVIGTSRRKKKLKLKSKSFDGRIIEKLGLCEKNKMMFMPVIYVPDNDFDKEIMNEEYYECKAKFVKSFRRILKKEFCPLKTDDEHCVFYIERVVRKQNKR